MEKIPSNLYVDEKHFDFVNSVKIVSNSSAYSLIVNGFLVSINLDFDDTLSFLNFVLSFFDTCISPKDFSSWLEFLSRSPEVVDTDSLHCIGSSF